MASPVGFIGLGIMGRGMVRNLLKGRDQIVAWNRSPGPGEELLKEFPEKVKLVSSAAEVIQECQMTYSMLSTLEASEAVFPSVAEAMAAGKFLVDCATLSPARMTEMASAVEAKGGKFLEAPVSGSKVPAEQGQLIFLTAGDKEVADACAEDMKNMGKASFFLGEVGKGSQMKLVVNAIMGVQLNALSEGLNLAEACGLPSGDLTEILKLGAMSSPLVAGKMPVMANKTYAAHFPLKHAQKDMRLAVALGEEHGVGLPVMAASNEQYKVALRKHGDDDFSAVAEASRSNKLL